MTESLPKGECFMKNGEITVRFAAENELARVNELREQVSRLHAENRPDVFRPDFCNELRQIAKNAFDADDSDVVVVCMDGDICGFAIPEYIERQKSCCRRAEKFCRISEFGVDAALRRRGAASAMIDFCRTEAKKRKLERLELDVWSFNRDAVRFYEAAGFETYRQYMEVKP